MTFFKTVKVALVAASLLGALGASANADPRDFEFVNLTSSTSIVGAWMARAGTRDPWDSIGLYRPISPRSTSRIDVSGGSSCVFDLKVLMSDGQQKFFTNIDLCRTGHLVVS